MSAHLCTVAQGTEATDSARGPLSVTAAHLPFALASPSSTPFLLPRTIPALPLFPYLFVPSSLSFILRDVGTRPPLSLQKTTWPWLQIGSTCQVTHTHPLCSQTWAWGVGRGAWSVAVLWARRALSRPGQTAVRKRDLPSFHL